MVIGFIGAGNMGGALVRALFLKTKTYNNKILVYDHQINKQKSTILKEFSDLPIKLAKNEIEIFRKCTIVFFGIKPKDSVVFFNDFKNYISAKHIIVTMIAGLSIPRIRVLTKNSKLKVCRIMPNLAAGIGESVGTVTYSPSITEKEKEKLQKILSCSGKYIETKESLVNAVTSISGCGPAFVFLFIEALIQAGKNVGINEHAAKIFALETIKGATALVNSNKKSPLKLTDEVSSPGGMTIEGVNHLKQSTFEKDIISAVQKSFLKAKVLSPAPALSKKN